MPTPGCIPPLCEISAYVEMNVLLEFLHNHSLYPVQNFAGKRFIVPSALR